MNEVEELLDDIYERMTLKEARNHVQAILDEGHVGHCLACNQTVKKYPRRVYRTLLILLHNIANAPDGFRVPERVPSGDYAKLTYWNLVYKDQETKKYHATDRGFDFLRGEIAIPKYAYVFNAQVLSYSEEQVTVEQCLDEFDLRELLDPNTIRGYRVS